MRDREALRDVVVSGIIDCTNTDAADDADAVGPSGYYIR